MYPVSTVGVNLVDQIPILVLHVLKADIPEDTSVVNEDIHATKVLDSSVDDGFAVLDAVVVGDGLAPGGFDLVDHNIGSLRIAVSASRFSVSLIVVKSSIPLTSCPHRSENRPGRSRRHWRLSKRRKSRMPYPDHHQHR